MNVTSLIKMLMIPLTLAYPAEVVLVFFNIMGFPLRKYCSRRWWERQGHIFYSNGARLEKRSGSHCSRNMRVFLMLIFLPPGSSVSGQQKDDWYKFRSIHIT